MVNPLRFVGAGFRWTRKTWAMLRELRTHGQQILSTRDLLARELRANAEIVGRWEDQQWSMQNVMTALNLERWRQDATAWSSLRRKHLDLWTDIADAYGSLEG